MVSFRIQIEIKVSQIQVEIDLAEVVEPVVGFVLPSLAFQILKVVRFQTKILKVLNVYQVAVVIVYVVEDIATEVLDFLV